MSRAQTDESIRRRPLRLWPGVAAAALIPVGRLVLPVVAPERLVVGILGAAICGLLIVLWWAFFSRAPRAERWGAVGLMAVALFVTTRLLHVSIATSGMGVMFYLNAIPLLGVAFVLWAVAARGLADRPRRATMVATILLACGVWALLRTGGITGDARSQFAWRWAPTAEERLLARGEEEPAALPVSGLEVEAAADWPGFRGPGRDGVVAAVRLATDWAASPPVELWRRPVGPGWSSFAVFGDLLYTQEQRGDDEVVACYRASTGEPIWRHRDEARFWESQGGAGPRATPAVSGGRVYTLGATGILNALDAADGSPLWSRDAAADTGAEMPDWAFSGSPLVVDDAVIVAASGTLAAYDAATGQLRWTGPAGGTSYSSPQRAVIGGVEQVVLLSETGAIGVAPAEGALLWEHAWPGYPIVQPASMPGGDLLLSVTADSGTRRIAVARGAEGWAVTERWTSRGLKPYYNDLVVHEGHAFGFDGSILASVDLESGKRNWKGGRYGHGQLILLPEQDLLLVLSERGELALVEATPGRFTELARLPALEGKTWNHPVLVGDLLLVRNGREMAAFRLSRAG